MITRNPFFIDPANPRIQVNQLTPHLRVEIKMNRITNAAIITPIDELEKKDDDIIICFVAYLKIRYAWLNKKHNNVPQSV